MVSVVVSRLKSHRHTITANGIADKTRTTSATTVLTEAKRHQRFGRQSKPEPKPEYDVVIVSDENKTVS